MIYVQRVFDVFCKGTKDLWGSPKRTRPSSRDTVLQESYGGQLRRVKLDYTYARINLGAWRERKTKGRFEIGRKDEARNYALIYGMILSQKRFLNL